MKIDFFSDFSDPYMETKAGQGVFLAGITLGVIAQCQAKDLESAPLFKQINFGRVRARDLKNHLTRVSDLVKAYDLKMGEIEIKGMVRSLAGEADKLILQEENFEMGVDGNFVFATAFLNSREYFWKIFSKKEPHSVQDDVDEGLQK